MSWVPENAAGILDALHQMHHRIREEVVTACERQSIDQLSRVDRDGAGDTIYAIDQISETAVTEMLSGTIAQQTPIVLIAEGLAGDSCVLPVGSGPDSTTLRIIVDPIDGTRGLMYQKRSAWVLTGVAPDKGDATSLADIELALMTEIPLVKQHLSDQLWAFRGGGILARRFNRLTGDHTPLLLEPSGCDSIKHGCVTFARFFPGVRDVLAAIDDEVVREVLGPTLPGKALCFEDQYICTGGQLYELIAGHDRFTADLRSLTGGVLAERGQSMPLCCHPYDLCTALIAEEAGVVITDEHGRDLNARLNVSDDVAWVGYANRAIRGGVEPALRSALLRHGLLDPGA